MKNFILNHKRAIFFTIITIILFAIMVGIIYYQTKSTHEALLEMHKEAIESHLFNNGGTPIGEIVDDFKEEYSLTSENDSSDEEFNMYKYALQLTYKRFNNSVNEYLSDSKLTKAEHTILIDELNELIEDLKEYQNDCVNKALSDYSDNSFSDSMNDFTKEFNESLDTSKKILVSYWDKLYKGDTVNENDDDKYQQTIEFFKEMSSK